MDIFTGFPPMHAATSNPRCLLPDVFDRCGRLRRRHTSAKREPSDRQVHRQELGRTERWSIEKSFGLLLRCAAFIRWLTRLFIYSCSCVDSHRTITELAQGNEISWPFIGGPAEDDMVEHFDLEQLSGAY